MKDGLSTYGDFMSQARSCKNAVEHNLRLFESPKLFGIDINREGAINRIRFYINAELQFRMMAMEIRYCENK